MKALLILSALAVTATAEVLQAAPALSGWSSVGRSDSAKRITVRLALKKDQRGVERKVADVASPGSPNFRQWASKAELEALRPVANGASVVAHLRQAGVESRVQGDSVVAEMTVAQAERVFSTTIQDYKDSKGQVWHRAGDVHAPVEVAASVAAVYGLHGLPLPPRTLRTSKKGALKANGQVEINVAPADLRAAYAVPSGTRGSGRSGSPRQAVAEFQGQYSNSADLTTFFQQYVPFAQPGDDKVFAFKGNKGSGYGIEALLDIQYIMGVAPGIHTEFWGWRNFDFCSDLKNWTQTILSDQDPPVVFSISYGWQGDLSQIGCAGPQVADIDKDLQSIAARGISIIFASGDSGSQQQGGKLWASWPASSNWVTAVGATTFQDQSKTVECASDQFGSGSGFSSMFPQSPFQRAAVQKYLSAQGSNLPPSSYFDANGRATADVSALGEGYEVVVSGQTEIVGGTSASTPCFSAMISLKNDAAFLKGQKPLGFLNPYLYNMSASFTDVTCGSDKISRGGTPFQYGFNCATGWDPATGLGTPIFTRL